jgi:hypothetical protein
VCHVRQTLSDRRICTAAEPVVIGRIVRECAYSFAVAVDVCGIHIYIYIYSRHRSLPADFEYNDKKEPRHGQVTVTESFGQDLLGRIAAALEVRVLAFFVLI